MVLSGLGERLRDRYRAAGIEVHQHVVEDEGERLGALAKVSASPSRRQR